MGPNWAAEVDRFPIPVKCCDCAERLSLQRFIRQRPVAGKLKGEPKNGEKLVYCPTGRLKRRPLPCRVCAKGVTRKAFEKAHQQRGQTGRSDLPACRAKRVRGFFGFVPSGRIHAIDAGNLILEIQQNSDTTYRVYDWGRGRAGWATPPAACEGVDGPRLISRTSNPSLSTLKEARQMLAQSEGVYSAPYPFARGRDPCLPPG